MRQSALTQEIVQSLLSYDPETGELRWRERGLFWFSNEKGTSERDQKKWNGRFAGKEAGTLTSEGYIDLCVLNEKHRAHRIIWLFMTGRFPSEHIDHINGARADNRWCNLREATNAENARNKIIEEVRNGGFRGVTRHSEQKWRAAISDRKTIHLGIFDTPEEAYAAYCGAAKVLGFTDRHVGKQAAE